MPSEYDFSLEKAGQLPHFDPERIAEEAVWPAVNHLWRGEWRNDTFAGHDFAFPGRGVGLHEDVVFDVVLSAECHGVPSDTDSSELGHTAMVQIERVVIGGLREIVFRHARVVEPDMMDAVEDYPGLLTKAGIVYSFDTHEDPEISAFQSVEDQHGTVIWVSDRLDEHEMEEMGDDGDGDDILFDIDRFHKHDIENIASALSILDAPESCIRALNIIKGQPLAVETDEADE